MVDYNGERNQPEAIDVTLERNISVLAPESGIAKEVIQHYAKHAQETEGWSGTRMTDTLHYDDTDGSDMHAPQPGINAFIEVRAPSGQLYRAVVDIGEESLELIDRKEHPENYDCLVEDSDWQ